LQLVKDDFIAALRTRSFNQLKISTKTSSHPTCNCFNYADDFNSQNASPPREHTSNPEKGNDTEFDRYLRQRVHTTPLENASPPLPSRLPSLSSVPVFRPEPIFPQSSNNSTYSKVPQLSPPEARRGYQQQPEDDDDKSQRGALILPMPQYMPSGYQYQQQQNTRQNDPRRSAFTIASLSEKDEHNYKRNSNRYLNSTSNSSTSSTSPPSFPSSAMDNSNNEALNSLIPVIYTPSNKKRKKNSAIMPAEATSKLPQSLSPPLTSTAMTTARPGGQIYQKQQQSQQQVNTAVRTYYEVDRDSQGTYILPVEIDSWTVVELGTVIYDRPAYHNQRYIYPANYTVRK
jgi:hypothetical protein